MASEMNLPPDVEFSAVSDLETIHHFPRHQIHEKDIDFMVRKKTITLILKALADTVSRSGYR